MFVNGQLVPFSMKIGDAGEAFFVFETEEEIPDNLVTSPILEATKPGETNAHARETGRFGAGPASPPVKVSSGSNQEPEFLDLNATAEVQSREGTPSPSSRSRKSSEDNKSIGSRMLERNAQLGKAMVGAAKETEKAEADRMKDSTVIEGLKEAELGEREYLRDEASEAFFATPKPSGAEFPSVGEKADAALPGSEVERVHEPDVKYTDGKSARGSMHICMNA